MKNVTTINGWTKQSMIDHIKKEFKGQSFIDLIDDDGDLADRVCAYRGEKGAKCAVGMFIPDGLYDRALEGTGAVALINIDTPALQNRMPLEATDMESLQCVHDDAKAEVCLIKMLNWIEDNVVDAA